MPVSVFLGSRTFTAATLRRTGGRLTFNDELIKAGSEVIFAHALSDVASLVGRDNRLVPVFVRDITAQTFEYVGEVPPKLAQSTFLKGAKHEVIGGNLIEATPGTVLRRTGRPFSSLHERYAPYGQNITIGSVSGNMVWFDTADLRLRHFSARYLTDGYFHVVRP